MRPLTYGIGSGADMLRPMAIAVIGALLFSDMLALVANLPVGPFVGAAFGWAWRRLGFARKSD